MAEYNSADSTDDRLIRRQLDGLLSDDEFRAFNDRLASDVSFRRRFVQLVDLDSALHETFASSPAASAPLPVPDRRWPWIALAVASACAAVLVLSVLSFLRDDGGLGNALQQQVAHRRDSQPEAVQNASAAEASGDGSGSPVAVVAGLNAEFDGGLRVGQRLKSGLLKFSAGQVQLEFLSGARVAIAGPAEMQIESPLQATLKSGRVSTYVPARARGFVLNGPGAAIVDLGTEFRMSVDANGMTDVAVTDGEIELSLLGEDGNTLVSKRLAESGSVRFGQESGQIEDGSFDPGEVYPSIELSAIQPLQVSEDYVTDVKNLEPVLYWRFDGGQIDVPADESGQSVNLILHNEASADCVRFRDGYVHFRRDESALRFLQTETPLDQLASGPVSFEFWMWPDDLQHSTCIGVYPDDDAPGRNHLNVIEVVSDTFLIHDPGAVRFLVRSPPERDAKFGINAFTPGCCAPGQWQHVAAVWDNSEIRLYFNGQLMRRVSTDQTFGDGRFHVIVGQLKPYVTERQFSGAIDEFAVYRRALTDQDVQRHFQRIAVANPQCTAQPDVTGDSE